MKLSPIIWLIATTTAIRIFFAATTGLGVDESYMVTSGRALSLGYFDHPPASWWLSWAAIHLLGSEASWAVRLPFIILFVLSQILVWRITYRVAGRQAAFWAVVALNLSPVFSVTTASWVLPDGPLDAALLGATLSLLNALSATGRRVSMWWALSGLCAGLALFSKYSAALTISGAFLFLLTSRQHRAWLTRFEPYIAILLALVVFSPVVIWNASHGWASFAFQGDRAIGLRFRPRMPFVVLAGEALFILPWLWVPMMTLLISGFSSQVAWPQRLLVWLAVPPIAVFAFISAWSSQRVLYHWAAPGYLMMFPGLGSAIANCGQKIWVRRLLAGSAIMLLASVVITVIQIQFDLLGDSLTVVMRSDPTAEGIAWTSLRDDLQVRKLLQAGAVTASLNWRDAGKIGYGLGPSVTMLCLSLDSRQFGIAYPLRDYAGQDVLVLALGSAEKVVADAAPWFRTVEVLPAVSVRSNGRVLKTIVLLRGRGLTPHH